MYKPIHRKTLFETIWEAIIQLWPTAFFEQIVLTVYFTLNKIWNIPQRDLQEYKCLKKFALLRGIFNDAGDGKGDGGKHGYYNQTQIL